MIKFMAAIFALLCLLTTDAGAQAPTSRPTGDEFATFGVAVETPAGWHRIWEGRGNMVARWANAADSRRATAVITLELELANGRTLAQHAEELRRSFQNAQIGIHALTLGGAPAMRVTGKDATGSAAVDTLIALNDQYFYALTGYAAVPGLLPNEAIGAMSRSLKFVRPADPSTAIALRDPITLLERFKLSPLTTMRPDSEPPERGHVALMVTNYRTNSADFLADISILGNPARLPLATLGQRLTEQASPRAPVEWGVMRSTPPRAISKPFTFPLPDRRQIHTCFGLVQLSDTEAVLLNMNIGPTDPAIRTAWEKACEQLVVSLEPLRK